MSWQQDVSTFQVNTIKCTESIGLEPTEVHPEPVAKGKLWPSGKSFVRPASWAIGLDKLRVQDLSETLDEQRHPEDGLRRHPLWC